MCRVIIDISEEQFDNLEKILWNYSTCNVLTELDKETMHDVLHNIKIKQSEK